MCFLWPFTFEASLISLAFTESSSCVFKVSVGCQYFFLKQYQETVLRVHFKEGCSFFSEEAKSPEFRHAAIGCSELRFCFFLFKRVYCRTLISKHTVVSSRTLNFCSVMLLGWHFCIVPMLGQWDITSWIPSEDLSLNSLCFLCIKLTDLVFFSVNSVKYKGSLRGWTDVLSNHFLKFISLNFFQMKISVFPVVYLLLY